MKMELHRVVKCGVHLAIS